MSRKGSHINTEYSYIVEGPNSRILAWQKSIGEFVKWALHVSYEPTKPMSITPIIKIH